MNIPFHKQRTGFTCDPACLIMALRRFDSRIRPTLDLEFDLWRESYGIGIPGCMPQGLAVAALRKGLSARIICPAKELVHVSAKLAPGENKWIAEWTSRRLLHQAEKLGARLSTRRPVLRDLEHALHAGGVPLVMIQMQRLHGIDSPHWVAITQIDSDSVSFHDPFKASGRNTRVSHAEFKALMSDLRRLSGISPRALIVGRK